MKFSSFLLVVTVAVSSVVSQSPAKVVVGYFSDWTLDNYPVSAIDFSKVTHINYAFALFTDNGFNPKIETESTLVELVTKAHQTSTKVSISIGGWTGSKYFSPMVADAAKRKQFVANTLAFVNKFNLDGIDLDWEYPGREGAEGNIVSPQDTANYLLLLKDLRAALGTKLITAAVRIQPFDGPNGPVKDVKDFAPLFDWLNLMCYDLNGPWETQTGPVGGLDYQSGKGTPFSVKQAVRDWSKAGFTYDKLVVGVPFYGYAEGVGVDMTNTDQYQQITNANLPSYAYNDLITQKILKSPTEANDATGWIRKYDPITQTPWLFNKNTKTFVAYDDIQSLKAKTDYVRCNGLRGAMLWSMDNDYQNQLISALQNVYNTDSCSPSTTSTTTTTSTTSSTTPITTTSTTTSVITTSSSTSTTVITTSTTSVTSTSQGPEPTGSCQDGSYTCGATKGSTYYQCAFSKWIKLSCPGTSVCVQAGTSIYCGNP